MTEHTPDRLPDDFLSQPIKPPAPGRPTQAESAREVTGFLLDDVPVREDRNEHYEVFSFEYTDHPVPEPGTDDEHQSHHIVLGEVAWRYNSSRGGIRLNVLAMQPDMDHIREFHPEQVEEAEDTLVRRFAVVAHRDVPWGTTQEPDENGRYYRELTGQDIDMSQFAPFDVMDQDQGVRVYPLLQAIYRNFINVPTVEVDQ